jgi:uncharacterized NAD(P)/FAD-binding protein YdhS
MMGKRHRPMRHSLPPVRNEGISIKEFDALRKQAALVAPMREALEKAKNYNIDLRNMINDLDIDFEPDRNSIGIVLGRQRGTVDAAIALAQKEG